MNSFVNAAISFILLYKYAALFFITFVSALIFPLPSATTIIGASAFSQQDLFNFYLVLLTAWVGNIAGDNLGFFLARRYGRDFLIKYGFKRLINSKKLEEAERFISFYPRSTVYFTRFLAEIGPLVNILAGLGKTKYRTFLFFDLLGEASFVLLYGILGYVFGDNWQNLASIIGKGTTILAVIALVAIILFFKFNKKRTV